MMSGPQQQWPVLQHNRFLILVPHEGTHSNMCLLKQLSMFEAELMRMRAIEDTMLLIAKSPDGAESGSA